MPAQGPITDRERWVITIDVAGERSEAEANKLAGELDKLVKKYNKPNKKATWGGKTRKKS
jgi:hypothetical protein